MTELAFLFGSALKNIRKNKIGTASKFFSSLFSLFFVLLLAGSYGGGAAFARERCGFRDIGSLKMYVAEEEAMLPKNPSDAEHFILYAYAPKLLFGGKYLSGAGAALTDIDFGDLFDGFCAKGEYVRDAKSECVIGSALAKRYGIDISDKITVGAKKYAVRGITDNAGYRDTVLLCEPDGLEPGYPVLYVSAKELSGNGLKYNGEQIRDYFSSMINAADLLPIIAVCAAMLVFSAVNVLNIAVVEAKRSAMRIRVRRSVGASLRAIFVMRFAENLIINVSAFVMSFTLMELSRDILLIVLGTSLVFGFWGICAAVISAAVLSLVYSLGTLRKEVVCFL